ncbi:MAG: hypothetical protein ACK5LY_03820 [Lachnospirales bacterium]
MDINKLYEKKAEHLLEILKITENLTFTDDMESNINKFNALFTKRKEIFAKVYSIDDEMRAMHPSEPIFDANLKEIAKKIYEIDLTFEPRKKEFKDFLTEKIRTLKQSRKTRQKFSAYAKNDVSTFESKA